MNHDLQLLTATGARPGAFRLLQEWMRYQTYKGEVHWIIVDDGPEPSDVTFQRAGWKITVLRPTPYWEPGMNTQARNLLAGLEHVDRTRPLLVIEDDDWYPSNYLEKRALALMTSGNLVGEEHAPYYNVRTNVYRTLTNGRHSSLCATGMVGRAIDAFAQVCKRSPTFIDMHLWRDLSLEKRLYCPRTGGAVVGLKGLPGRAGIGVGHSDDFSGAKDVDDQMLCIWTGRRSAALIRAVAEGQV